MQSHITLIAVLFLLLTGCESGTAPGSEVDDDTLEMRIRWRGSDSIANHLAMHGLDRYITYENHHAFIFSEAAVQRDSTLFASHALLAMLAEGDRRIYHRSMALRHVADENETSKLFVKLLDYDETNDSTRTERRQLWTRMHELSNSPFIHYMYTRYMEGDNAAKIRELDKLIAFCKEHQFTYTATAASNYKGYLLKREGDLAGGIAAIEQCVELHPAGYNPCDSRAEFYLYAGDTLNAIIWYQKTLEQYPYSDYSREQLRRLEQ